MSTRVVSESHAFGDDYVWVPSFEEFEALETKHDVLARRVVSDVRIVKSQGEKIRDTASRISGIVEKLDSVKSDIESELTNGSWKAALVEITKELCSDVENKLHEINEAIASQMSDLVKHEMAARTLADELVRMKEDATKEIVVARDAARNEIDSSVATGLERLNGKTLESCEQSEDLSEAFGKYGVLQKQVSESSSRITGMERELERARNELVVLSEKVSQKGEEFQKKMEDCSMSHSLLKRIGRKVKISKAFAILALILSIICLCVK